MGLSAFDAGGSGYKNAPYFNLIPVSIPSGGNGSIVVTVTWGSGDDGGDLYIATASGDAFHQNQTLTTGQASATITTLDQSTPGGPDPLFDHFGVFWQQEIHGGVWAQQVQADPPLTSTPITIAGAGMTTNQWAGYTLSLLAKFDPLVEIPILNMPVASSTASDGALPTRRFATARPHGSAAPDSGTPRCDQSWRPASWTVVWSPPSRTSKTSRGSPAE